MRTLIRHVTRKSRGGTAVREEFAEGDIIVAGRGNDCGIRLPDPRVMLHHAEFSVRNGEDYVSAVAGADLRVDGNLTQVSKLNVGTKIRIGPYEIVVQETVADLAFTVTVELVQALGDDLENLVARSRIHIDRIGLTMRQWAWLLVLTVLLGTFAVPLTFNILADPQAETVVLNPQKQNYTHSPTGIWTSGTLSAPHKFFGESCETCHETPFVPVRDKACIACHAGVQNHVQATIFPFADVSDKACTSCHKEHQGTATIVLADQGFCTDCHGDLAGKTTRTSLGNASDFGTGHPEFRPTVIKDPALHTVDRSRAVGASPPPQENSGLKFPHDRHLRNTGIKDPVRGIVTLQCVDCHVPNETGETMRPASFERNCHGCHALKFDKYIPDREMTHGKPDEVFKQVHDIYDALAMRGGYEEPAAPPLLRRRPGTPLTPDEKKVMTDWAAAKSADVLNGYFGRGLCAECHQTLDTVPTDNKPADNASLNAAHTAESRGSALLEIPTVPSLAAPKTWTVEPPTLPTLWMPKAYFTHARHTSLKCEGCHAARASNVSSDVLMPSITVCRSCHGGEKADDVVPSSCIDCHKFHRRDMAPIHPAKAADAGAALPVEHRPHGALAAILPRWNAQ